MSSRKIPLPWMAQCIERNTHLYPLMTRVPSGPVCLDVAWPCNETRLDVSPPARLGECMHGRLSHSRSQPKNLTVLVCTAA